MNAYIQYHQDYTFFPTNALVEQGNQKKFKASLPVIWSIVGNTSSNTTITQNGLLSVGEDETATNIEVRANFNTLYSSANVKVGEYMQLEYIQSTGTQYINTGYKPNQDTKIEIDISYSDKGNPFGARTQDGILQYGLWFYWNSPIYYIKINSDRIDLNCNADLRNKRCLITMQNGNVKILDKVDNIEYNTDYTNVGNFSADYTMYLGALNQSNSLGNPIKAHTIYGCKIYENNVLIHNFIPAIDVQENVCLYDTVTEEFFYNQGTGAYIAGNPV